MTKDEQHRDEVERLVQAFGRDLSGAVFEMAGATQDHKAWDRLVSTWKQLCDLDLGVAARLYHGVEAVQTWLAQDGRASEHRRRGLDEMLDMARLAHEQHPDADVENLGKLVDLGNKAAGRDEVDRETSDDGEESG